MFISPNDEVYKGMIVGVHQRPSDLEVNICKVRSREQQQSDVLGKRAQNFFNATIKTTPILLATLVADEAAHQHALCW